MRYFIVPLITLLSKVNLWATVEQVSLTDVHEIILSRVLQFERLPLAPPIPMPPPFPPDYPPLPEEEMELSSEEESEYESGDEEDKERWGADHCSHWCVNVSSISNNDSGNLSGLNWFQCNFFAHCRHYSLLPCAWFISGLFVWWAWSTKHARDPWDSKQLQRERSPRSRIYSMLPNQTLRGTPKALMHVTVLTHSSSGDSILLRNLQTVSLPHKGSLVWLWDLLFQYQTCTHSLNDRPQTLLLTYQCTPLRLLATCL